MLSGMRHRVYCLAKDHANSICAPCGAGTLQICSLGAVCGAPRDLLKSVVIKSVPPHIPQPHSSTGHISWMFGTMSIIWAAGSCARSLSVRCWHLTAWLPQI
jgi:hypothetical protein